MVGVTGLIIMDYSRPGAACHLDGGAAGPAAAGQAAVMAVAGSFAVGAWNLPRDMIAQVHQGETILPAGAASKFRDMASGAQGSGGGDVHVHHATNFNVSANRQVSLLVWLLAFWGLGLIFWSYL